MEKLTKTIITTILLLFTIMACEEDTSTEPESFIDREVNISVTYSGSNAPARDVRVELWAVDTGISEEFRGTYRLGTKSVDINGKATYVYKNSVGSVYICGYKVFAPDGYIIKERAPSLNNKWGTSANIVL